MYILQTKSHSNMNSYSPTKVSKKLYHLSDFATTKNTFYKSRHRAGLLCFITPPPHTHTHTHTPPNSRTCLSKLKCLVLYIS